MFKMILADDEPVITRGIQKLVDWKKLGIEIVGIYQDGAAALYGIFSLKPDIALLDISMPKRTGLDILKEIKALGLGTKVIFISGFQEFEYVREALTYGAIGYLLKPIRKDEMVLIIEKCIGVCRELFNGGKNTGGYGTAVEESFLPEACEALMKPVNTIYLPVAVEVLYPYGTDGLEKRLIKFSVFSHIESYLQEKNVGIVFYKANNIVVILKGKKTFEAKQEVFHMRQVLRTQTRNEIGAVIGNAVDSLGEIPEAYQEAFGLVEYFFFSGEMENGIICVGEPVFQSRYKMKDLNDCREKVTGAVFSQDPVSQEAEFAKLEKIIAHLSDGKREDASFHFCSSICKIEERFEQMGLPVLGIEMKALLEAGRTADSFKEMASLYRNCMDRFSELVRQSVKSNDQKDIIKAKNYIESHYKENLSLEVLSGHIHMNSYYFSSFFKKHTGENFKDYLNKVRMKKALALLLATDMKNYRIAEEAGFRDTRYFSELFQRYYGETPSNYRKRLKK